MATNLQIEQGNRLEEARIADGRFTSAAQAAEALGVPAPTYQAHENGNRGFGASAPRYADFFKVNLEWLLTGRGPMKRSSAPENESHTAPTAQSKVPEVPDLPSQAIDLRVLSQDLPILGSGSCGDDGLFELNGQIQDYKRRPPKLTGVKDAYGLWVKGDSMFPWRRNGGLVFVHPHQPVNIGDFVVVQLKADGDGAPVPAYIKQLVRRTARELRLLQFNPNEELSVPSSKVHAIHRIVDWDELMGL